MNDFLVKALQQKILPAINIEDTEHVLPVTEAFLNAGLNVMEIQFRTQQAATAIEMIRKNFPEMNIGAGTLLSIEQLHNAINAGAKFGLSPSLNKTICNEAKQLSFPFIPGVMTPSEIEFAHELDFTILKLFPAAQLGGAAFLKAMLGPYEQLNRTIYSDGWRESKQHARLSQTKKCTCIGWKLACNKRINIKQKLYCYL